jgi:hypothetical protein
MVAYNHRLPVVRTSTSISNPSPGSHELARSRAGRARTHAAAPKLGLTRRVWSHSHRQRTTILASTTSHGWVEISPLQGPNPTPRVTPLWTATLSRTPISAPPAPRPEQSRQTAEIELLATAPISWVINQSSSHGRG